jgi:hypothetical protein
MAGVRIELGQRGASRLGEPLSNTFTVLATTTSDADGRFVFDELPNGTGLLSVRAVPTDGSGYRATRWIAAYSLTGPAAVIDSRSLGPYLVLERAGSPSTTHAPVLLAGDATGDEGRTPAAGASLVVYRMLVAPRPDSTGPVRPVLDTPVATARLDANGHFLVALPPGPGLYSARVTMRAGAPFKEVLPGGQFVAPGNSDVSVLTYLKVKLER